MKTGIFAVVTALLLIIPSVHAQYTAQRHIDSLHKVIGRYESGKEPDTVLCFAYANLARALLFSDISAAHHYAVLAVRYAKQFDDALLRSEVHAVLGKVYQRQGLTTLAFSEFSKAYEAASKSGLIGTEGFLLNDIANLYFADGIYDIPLGYYIRAAEIFRLHEKSDMGLAVSYNNIGLCYRNMGKYDSALIYFHKALRIREKMNLPALIVHSKNYIAEVYRRAGKKDSALTHARAALSLLGRVEIRFDEEYSFFAESNLLLARISDELGDRDGVFRGYQAALEIYNKGSNASGIAGVHLDFGRYCLRNGLYDEAFKNARSALHVQRGEKSLDGMRKANMLIGDIYGAMNLHAQAAGHYAEALRLADSLKNAEALSRRDAIDKTLEAIRNQSEYELSRQHNLTRLYIFGFSIVLLFIVAVVLYYRLRMKTRAENKLHQLINSTFEGIVISRKGIIIEVNQRFCSLLGYAQKELLGSPVTGLIVDDAVRAQITARQSKNEPAEYRAELKKKDGGTLIAEVISRGIEYEEGIARVAAIRDVTTKAETERELERARAESDRINRAKTEFLANVSHEIRTPMNTILGFAELLRGHVKEKNALGFINSIVSSGKNLLHLLNDILDVSKIEAGKFIIRGGTVNLRTIAKELAHTYEIQAQAKNVRFRFESSARFPEFVFMDEIRFRQICANLLSNAVKFTSKGNIIFSLSHEHTSGSEKAEVIVRVSDTGIGISEADAEIIFEAFHQVEAHSSRKFPGTGLGLTITKKLSELMNAEITVKSKPGEGAVFTVQFHDVPVLQRAEAKEADGSREKETPVEETRVPNAVPDTPLPVTTIIRRITQLKNGMVISEIEELSQELSRYAEMYQNAQLRGHAANLKQRIETYDPDGIGSALDELQNYLRTIEKTGRI